MRKILITDGLEKEGIRLFEEAGFVIQNKKLSHKELLNEIPPYDALVVRSATKVDREIIDAAQNLKIIGRAGVGVDNIDVMAASEKGIVVKNAPHGITNAAAELTINLMLSISRKTHQAYRNLKEGIWEKSRYEGTELRGKTLGIIGCGRIGSRVAQIASYGFDMTVLGYDVREIKSDRIKPVSLDELLEKSDYVSLHLPKLDKPIIGESELKKMKPTAYLINVSRGENVDEAALYRALRDGEIAGAAIDVYQREAKDGEAFANKLFELDNFIGTPHLGASTREAQKITAKEIAEIIIGYLVDGNWASAINVGADLEYKKQPTYNVFVTHDDKPGMFTKISGVFGKYNINIQDMPSRVIEYATENGLIKTDKAITIVRAQHPISEDIMNELSSLSGVYRVTK
jgi:D-3-phosphoglycerate dehydrogenase